MKKKWLTVVVLAMCLALVASLFTACGGKPVTVELSKTTLEMTVGESETLTATTSDGSEVEWKSSDDKIATVSTRGKVTAKGAGTATITATSGKATASCTVTVKEKVVVTFTFTAGGAAVTEAGAKVNRDGTVQLAATASDGSAITSWESEDTSIATVSETGLVTGIFDGETNITVKTATGRGSVKLTVEDNFQGEKYTIGTDKTKGQWWYYINGDANRSHELTVAEYRGGVVRFGFTGNCNWTAGDVQLGWSNAEVSEGWHSLTAKIHTDSEITVTLNGSAVKLAEGDNNVEVAYNQQAGGDSIIIQYNASINESNIVISDVTWGAFTPVTLATPTFTRGEDDLITINTTDTKGIAKYQIGLFKEGETTEVFTQDLDSASGKLDTSKCEVDGELIIRVRTLGAVGYTNSAWSTDNSQKVTVANGGLTYDIPAGGEVGAYSSGQWEYWTEGVVTGAKYENGTVTIKSSNIGGNWYGTQLFYRYNNFENGAYIKMTMKVKANLSGGITLRGTPFMLEANTERTIEVYTTQPGVGNTTVSIQLAVNNGGEEFPRFEIGEEELVVTFSDIKVETFTPEKFVTPSFTIADKIITITDTANAGKNPRYELAFYDAENALKATLQIGNGDRIDDRKIEDGTYTVKLRATSTTINYSASDWSEGSQYTVAHGAIQYQKIEAIFAADKFVNGAEGDAKANKDKWYYWYVQDAGWNCGAVVNPFTPSIDAETKTITMVYQGGDTDWSVQLFYVNSGLTKGERYKLTLNVNTAVATDVKVNGVVKTLAVGDNAIEIDLVAGETSFSMQICGTDHEKGAHQQNTIKISNVAWTELPPAAEEEA